MTYTPYVWHDGATGGTLVDAAHLNRIEQGIADAAASAGTGSADPSREFAPENYGAIGDGVSIDRAAIQAAIDAANTRYVATGVRQTVPITRIHLLDAIDYTRTDGTVLGAVSLMLKDGVELGGHGTLKVKNGAYGNGAFYAAIRSPSSGLSNAAIRDLTIDGNRANNIASSQCSNVVLEAKASIEITGVRSINANGNGIMVRGAIGAPMQDVSLRRCTVSNAADIAIQCSQFTGLDVDNNTLTDCSEGVDVYGENGSVASSGIDFRISNNRIRNCGVGIFLETVASGVVSGNHVRGGSIGGTVNRINGEPRDINIVGNTFIGCSIGYRVTGDTGGINIRNNVIGKTVTAGIQLGGGGNISTVFVLDNTIDTANQNQVPLVLVAGNQASFLRHRGTITQNTDRSKDTVVTATTSVGNVYSPANVA